MNSSQIETLKLESKGVSKTQKFNQNLKNENEAKIEGKQNIPYDPKKCIKIALEELIPTLGAKIVFEIDEHHHFINFYKASKSFLSYYEAPTNIQPGRMNEPYSDFESLVGKLTKKDIFKFDANDHVKVECYENESHTKYVIKTFWIEFDFAKKDPASLKNADKFASKKYNEFAFAKVFSSCPHSVKVIDLNFIYLKEERTFISELLEIYGGKPITKILKDPISDSKLV